MGLQIDIAKYGIVELILLLQFSERLRKYFLVIVPVRGNSSDGNLCKSRLFFQYRFWNTVRARNLTFFIQYVQKYCRLKSLRNGLYERVTAVFSSTPGAERVLVHDVVYSIVGFFIAFVCE